MLWDRPVVDVGAVYVHIRGELQALREPGSGDVTRQGALRLHVLGARRDAAQDDPDRGILQTLQVTAVAEPSHAPADGVVYWPLVSVSTRRNRFEWGLGCIRVEIDVSEG